MSEITFSQSSSLDAALKKAYISCQDTLIVQTRHALDGSEKTKESYSGFQKQWENVKSYIEALSKIVNPGTKLHIHFSELHPLADTNRWSIIVQIAGRTAFRAVFESKFFALPPLAEGEAYTDKAEEFWKFTWKTSVSVSNLPE